MVDKQTYTVPLPKGHPDQAMPGAVEPHDSMLKTLDVIANAYDFCVGDDGRLYGLVSGDMGWAATSIVIQPDQLPQPQDVSNVQPSEEVR